MIPQNYPYVGGNFPQQRQDNPNFVDYSQQQHYMAAPSPDTIPYNPHAQPRYDSTPQRYDVQPEQSQVAATASYANMQQYAPVPSQQDLLYGAQPPRSTTTPYQEDMVYSSPSIQSYESLQLGRGSMSQSSQPSTAPPSSNDSAWVYGASAGAVAYSTLPAESYTRSRQNTQPSYPSPKFPYPIQTNPPVSYQQNSMRAQFSSSPPPSSSSPSRSRAMSTSYSVDRSPNSYPSHSPALSFASSHHSPRSPTSPPARIAYSPPSAPRSSTPQLPQPPIVPSQPYVIPSLSDLPRSFFCREPGCSAAFHRSHDLARHSKIHTGDKPFSCSRCRRKFGRNDALKRHVARNTCTEAGGEDESEG